MELYEKNSDDSESIALLMKLTFAERRREIREQTSGTYLSVVDKFPHLKQSTSIVCR